MEKKIFVQRPWITTYPTQSYFVACDKKGLADYWLLEFSLNLSAKYDLQSRICSGKVDFYSPEPFRACPWIKHQEIWYEFLPSLNIDFIEFVVCAIDQNYYVLLKLDRFYIECAPEYGESHFQHDVFIYGYDIEKKELYFADFYPYFGFFSMSFDNARNAFRNLKVDSPILFRENIILIKPDFSNIKNQYVFRLERVLNQIREYINGIASYEGYFDLKISDYEINRQRYVFGIDTYEYQKSYIETQIMMTSKKMKDYAFVEWDHRGVHAIYMHKLLVKKLFDYLLCDNRHRKEIIYLSQQYEYVIAKAFNIRNNYLKSKLKQSTKDLIPILRKIDELKKLELDILNHVLQMENCLLTHSREMCE